MQNKGKSKGSEKEKKMLTEIKQDDMRQYNIRSDENRTEKNIEERQ